MCSMTTTALILFTVEYFQVSMIHPLCTRHEKIMESYRVVREDGVQIYPTGSLLFFVNFGDGSESNPSI